MLIYFTLSDGDVRSSSGWLAPSWLASIQSRNEEKLRPNHQ